MTVIGFLIAVEGPIGSAAVSFYTQEFDLSCEASVSQPPCLFARKAVRLVLFFRDGVGDGGAGGGVGLLFWSRFFFRRESRLQLLSRTRRVVLKGVQVAHNRALLLYFSLSGFFYHVDVCSRIRTLFDDHRPVIG